jgi:predicted DNA-binding protein YlxM (UPF0122 family)
MTMRSAADERDKRDMELLEQRVRFGELFDAYSSLLTDKQREVSALLLDGDLSISELGEELGMTRQGAYDILRRSRDYLEDMERKLGLIELRGRYEAVRSIIGNCEAALPSEFMERIRRLDGVFTTPGREMTDV